MKFLIVGHTPHFKKDNKLFAYGPYVKEINLWINKVDEVEVLAPLSLNTPNSIHQQYYRDVSFTEIPAISLISIQEIIRTIFLAPTILFKIYGAMKRADHIHLRCPGNIGLLGCIVQLFFPNKMKTAKYAGNWEPRAKQPLSYKLQKFILSNTKLTKNMQVLVYGDWPNQSTNVKSFFTASYGEEKKEEVSMRKYDLPFRFLFVGSLSKGKKPLYVVKLIESIINAGIPSELHMYGDGILMNDIKTYIEENKLGKTVYLYGNQKAEEIEDAYKKSHFLILPSKSEGWPKVVAEAMWWGVIPIVTRISCVPWMLGEGSRGIFIKGKQKKDISHLTKELANKNALRTKSNKAEIWSRKYSLEYFDREISKLISR